MADVGIETAVNFPLTAGQRASRQLLRLADAPRGIAIKRKRTDIPGVVASTIKSLMAQIAFLETENNLSYNQNSRYGRYAIHKTILINYGYLSADGRKWTGLEGIETVDDFLISANLQDRILERFIQEQYSTGIAVGSIKSGDSVSTIVGMLAVAYQHQDYTFRSNKLAPNTAVVIDNIEYFNLNNEIRVSTTTAHGLFNEDQFVVVTQGNTELNGTYSVDKVIDTLTITYVNETTSNANISLTNDGGTITNPNPVGYIDSSYIINKSANLSTYLGTLLSNQGFSNIAFNYYRESGIQQDSEAITVDNLLTSSSSIDERKLYSVMQNINSDSVQTTSLVETALFANIGGLNKQRAVSNASAGLSSFNTKLTKIYSNLPALRAKEWRELGNIKDSQGRLGALFFNAGKYAVDILGAGTRV